MKYGDKVTVDALGQDICIGDVAYTTEWYSGSLKVWPRVILGTVTASGNLRNMIPRKFPDGIALIISWEPIGKAILMHAGSSLPIAAYVNDEFQKYMHADNWQRELLFNKYIKTLSATQLRKYNLEYNEEDEE